MKISRKDLIILIAIAVMVAGIIGIYGIIASLLNLPKVQVFSKIEFSDEFSLISVSLISIINFTIQLIFYSSMIITGLLLFKFKPAGLVLIILLSWLHLYHLLISFAIEGLIWNETYYLLLTTITIFILFFFNSKSLKALFPIKQNIKVIQIILCIILIILLIIYFSFILFIHNTSKYNLEYTNTEFNQSIFNDYDEIANINFSNLFTVSLPINKIKRVCSLCGSSTSFVDIQDSIGMTISIAPCKEDLYYGFNIEKINKLDRSDLSISRKINNERLGIKYLSLNGKIEGLFSQSDSDYGYFEFENNDLIFTYSKDAFSITISIYKEEINVGSIDLVNLKSEDRLNNLTIDAGFINEFISSISPINDQIKSADYYNQKGLTLYQNNEFVRALLNFFTSYSIDSENIGCKLYLIKSIISSKDFTHPDEEHKWYCAKVELEKMLETNPDDMDVKDLYMFVESEFERYK